MGNKEPNAFKAALGRAKDAVKTHRDGLSATDTLGGGIVTQIASHGGWECTEATSWVTDFRGKASPILGEFDTAYSELNTEWASEPDEVPEGDWRGNAYHARAGGGRNIPQ